MPLFSVFKNSYFNTNILSINVMDYYFEIIINILKFSGFSTVNINRYHLQIQQFFGVLSNVLNYEGLSWWLRQ